MSSPTKTPSGMVRIGKLEAVRVAEWDDYVVRHPAGTVFHTIGWKNVVQSSFPFQARYIFAENQGSICGVLPLFIVKNHVIGKALISTPFAVYGGICADEPHASVALRNAACALAEQEQVEYLELREPVATEPDPRFHIKELYVSFDRELPADEDALMKAIPRDTRYMIRKGQKAGLRSEVGNHQLDTLYEVFAISLRNLGTPVFDRKYFHNILTEFGDKVEIVGIYQGSQMVAGVMNFRFRDWIVPYYSGSTPAGKKVAANNFMYWEVMRYAISTGLRRFDFGRSKLNTGACFFKSQWAMTQRALPYQYYLVRRKEMPNFSPANRKFELAVKLWQHMPISLSKVIGPTVVKLFP